MTGIFSPFDTNGNLPAAKLKVGHVCSMHASLVDLKSRFVDAFPTSTKRRQIWEGWMAHRRELLSFDVPFSTMVNGSFITRKTNPNDIDFCCIIDSQVLNKLNADDQKALFKLFDVEHCQREFMCDPYFVGYYEISHLRFQDSIQGITYWQTVFGADRAGRPKSYALVTDKGVL